MTDAQRVRRIESAALHEGKPGQYAQVIRFLPDEQITLEFYCISEDGEPVQVPEASVPAGALNGQDVIITFDEYTCEPNHE